MTNVYAGFRRVVMEMSESEGIDQEKEYGNVERRDIKRMLPGNQV